MKNQEKPVTKKQEKKVKVLGDLEKSLIKKFLTNQTKSYSRCRISTNESFVVKPERLEFEKDGEIKKIVEKSKSKIEKMEGHTGRINGWVKLTKELTNEIMKFKPFKEKLEVVKLPPKKLETKK